MQTVEAADYHDIAFPSEPRVAPDGESVAFCRRVAVDDETTRSTVFLVSTGGGEPRRFTVDEGTDSEPRFSPSGDRLAFVSTRGADDDRPQLWVVPTDGGEARQVTDVAGGVSEIAWAPDGERIAFCQQVSAADREEERDLEVSDEYEPEDPDPRVIDRTVYRSAERYFDERRSQVYLVDLGDDAPGSEDEIERLTDDDTDFLSPTWGDDETLYYAERVGPDPDDSVEYAIVARSDGESERIYETTAFGPVLAATDDGRVAHTYQEPDRASLRPTELHVYDRATGDVADATADLDRSLGYEVDPQWGPADEYLYAVAPDAGSVPVWRVPWEGGDPERVVADGHVSGAHVGTDLVAYVTSEWDHPGDVFVATKGGGETNRLTRLNSDYLDERAVAQPEAVRFETGGDTAPTTATGEQASGGTDVQGWVLTPPEFGGPDQSGEGEQFPLAVEVHGGPHAMWSTAGPMWHEFQTLAARGYVVFWCNPRGSTGYGAEFAAAIADAWGPVTAEDVLAGVDAVTDRDYVDADDVHLTGGSFGGFMTSWLVGDTDRFASAATQRGVHDLTGFYGSTDGAYKLVEGDFGATPWDDAERLWDHSPVAYCDEIATPTLVLHSDDDYRTPANTADLFYRGLRKHGVDTRFVRYPREGHELSRSGEPGHVVDRIERIARWFDGYSTHHDAERALDRSPDAGLTAGEDDDPEGDGDGDGNSDE